MSGIYRFFKRIILFFSTIAFVFCGYIVCDGYKLYQEVITNISIEEKINEIKKKDDYLTFEEIPKEFSNAIVAVEDKRFYTHQGFDIISIGRAFLSNMESKSFGEGGSTITQQLAKNMYFSFEKKFTRKVAELFVAIKLEKLYSKEDILSCYINIIYFGDGYYGLDSASKGYFSKEVSRLTFDEITLLAGLPNAPSAYALSTHKELAKKRQEVVISKMLECGYITKEQLLNDENYKIE